MCKFHYGARKCGAISVNADNILKKKQNVYSLYLNDATRFKPQGSSSRIRVQKVYARNVVIV
jgi:hypothetical protein